ncbi:hypothetical protein MPSEU_000139100 [Mayamaea pseudoterrestris]|nr:hypothetical protein MPSEU_000139100 [Mayamaea pseudoterrestris]
MSAHFDPDDDRKPPAADANATTANSEHHLNEHDHWSRLVETSNNVAPSDREDTSSNARSTLNQDDLDTDSRTTAADHAAVMQPPSHPELTMKERLVLRERQRRIETERARLKRQFALNNHGISEEEEEAAYHASETDMRDTTSVAEESTKAHPDDESNDESFGFNMERFLRNSDSFHPQLEPTTEELQHHGGNGGESGGVVMERFLRSEPMVQDIVENGEDLGGRHSISFDEDDTDRQVIENQDNRPTESFMTYGNDTQMSMNASVQVEADDDADDADVELDGSFTPLVMNHQDSSFNDAHSNASTEPRVLRLTEADMQEFHGIDQASIGNAPPSERDAEEISEIGELAHFERGDGIYHASGVETPTTAQESASIVSGGNFSAEHRTSAPSLASLQAASHASSDRDPADLLNNHSDGHLPDDVGSVGSMVDSINETHPPSVAAREDTENGFVVDGLALSQDEDDDPELNVTVNGGPLDMPIYLDEEAEAAIHRALRPSVPPLDLLRSTSPLVDFPALNEPIAMTSFADHNVDTPSSPVGNIVPMVSSFRNASDEEPWSPAGQMHVSPIVSHRQRGVSLNGFERNGLESAPLFSHVVGTNESTPLLLHSDVPPDIVVKRMHSDPGSAGLACPPHGCGNRKSIQSAVDSVFSGIRSDDDSVKEEINNDCVNYLNSSIIARAFPERMFALTVTLIFEIPVLLMISGGSDQLCRLIGRSRYQLLIGFLPLTSAISGNVGLQASTLTTRAISHNHVTPKSWWSWLVQEVGAACYLGLGMGLLLGTISFIASGQDYGFALTIFTAQFISVLTAGITGTFAPLLFSFIFRRDSGKWGGPLETAIQDIIGSFAMIVISYHLLRLFGPHEIAANDMCGSDEYEGS